MKQIISTDKAPLAIGPYVQGIRFGDIVITSGQLPIDPTTKLMVEGVANQTTQSLSNALSIIEESGLNVWDIVKTTVFVKDLNDFPVINEAYKEFFEQSNAPFPARSCVEVARLPMDAQVEIEVTACR
ncbi:Rid family detoxifying hydrolase [Vibrio atypicus]|jgi:2-iminobutanoate/2-iminopropanoate deaminase|uniref:Rid family detoxifying hydrolase n=1 Tax=Vibrio atypicus TaxID=558271 RepID=UPI001357963F|nr:Rid family detoxifying hydrolase [Vibrio atypicus]